MQLSVIIVNYNVKHFLEKCLHSVIKACKGLDAEIIVVDNSSSDGSREFLTPLFPQVTFLWMNENLGFAKANNRGLQHASGEYVLFLNPDTVVPEDCFTACMDFLKQKQNNGALGIRMIDGNGSYLKESKRGFPSLSASFFKLSGLSALFPNSKLFASYYMAHLPENKNAEVDVLAGAYMMIPKKILDEVGSFDERFFMYGEDVDLSYRIKKAGFHNYYFADKTIVHFKGESSKQDKKKYVNNFYGAMKLFVDKHYSPGKAFVFKIFISLLAGFKRVFG